MKFRDPKLNLSALESLRKFDSRSIMPYCLMPAPVYVLLEKNQKLVAVKAPLDFFTPSDLTRLRAFKDFYMPPSVDAVAPFIDAGQRVKAFFEQRRSRTPKDAADDVSLPPPFEVSDAILRIVGPLWGEELRVEPFFVALFIQESCGLFPKEQLQKARDLSIDFFERAVFHASWSAFIALHIANTDSEFVNRVRLSAFAKAIDEKYEVSGYVERELIEQARQTLAGGISAIGSDVFSTGEGRIARKISARLKRVKNELVAGARCPSIFGAGGFTDA